MTSGLVRVARVLRAPARRLSSGARPSYVHPLSEEVLSELRALRPAWFEEDAEFQARCEAAEKDLGKLSSAARRLCTAMDASGSMAT